MRFETASPDPDPDSYRERGKARGFENVIVTLAHVFFVLLVVALPTSKGLTSVGLTGLLILGVTKLYLSWKNLPARLSWLSYSPWILLVLLIISFFFSEDKATAWSVLYRQNTLLITPLVFWLFSDLLKKHFLLYLNFFVASISFCSFLTLLFFFLPETTTINLVSKLSFLQDYIVHEKQYAFGTYSPFLDRLHFSYLLGIALLLQFYLFFKNTKYGFLKLSLCGLNIVCFLILGGRGAQLGFLASASIWGIALYWKYLHHQIAKRFNKYLSISILSISLIVGTLVSPYLLYQNVPAVQDRYQQLRWEIGTYQDDTFTNYPYEHFTSLRRIMSWKYNWEIIKDNPISGTGIGDYQNNLQQLYDRDNIKIPINSHQQFLYFWAATGIFGFLIFIAIFTFFLLKSIRQKSILLKPLMLSFWLFYFIVFLFDTPLLYQTGGLAFWTFFLVLLHLASEKISALS